MEVICSKKFKFRVNHRYKVNSYNFIAESSNTICILADSKAALTSFSWNTDKWLLVSHRRTKNATEEIEEERQAYCIPVDKGTFQNRILENETANEIAKVPSKLKTVQKIKRSLTYYKRKEWKLQWGTADMGWWLYQIQEEPVNLKVM